MILAALLAAANPVTDAIRGALDPCAAPAGEGIVVCRRAPRDRYRLPASEDRGWDSAAGQESALRERSRLIDSNGEGPDLTRGSCSPAGASGATGCMVRGFRERAQQRRR